MRGFFDSEGGVDPTHGVPRAYNTRRRIIETVSSFLDELEIHHTVVSTRMNPVLQDKRNGRFYRRRELVKYEISIGSCCIGRYEALVSSYTERKNRATPAGAVLHMKA